MQLTPDKTVDSLASLVQQLSSPLKMAFPSLISPAAEGHVLTQQYALLPADLREVADLEAALEEAGFRPDFMTLVIAECVLVYMPPEDSQRLVSRLGELLPTAAFVVYEQVLSPRRLNAIPAKLLADCTVSHMCCHRLSTEAQLPLYPDRQGQWRCQC